MRILEEIFKKIFTRDFRNFLRFCTGANLIIGQNITVSFNNTTGFGKTPQAQTCTFSLKLPEFENYPEFRSEFNSILKSDMWVMDFA